MPKVICEVCGGKGGWKRSCEPWEDNWVDCLYCDSMGFYEKEDTEEDEKNIVLKYGAYKGRIIELLEEFCSIKKFNTENMGKTIHIQVIPYEKNMFITFIKDLLKFSGLNKEIAVETHQGFYLGTDKRYYYYWKLDIELNNIDNLEGLIAMMSAWVDDLISKEEKG